MKLIKKFFLMLLASGVFFLVLNVVNVLQNGGTTADGHTAEAILGKPLLGATVADLEPLSKSEIMQLFLVLPAPASRELTGEWNAALLDKGVLASLTALYTHRVFGPGRWVGKGFSTIKDGRGSGYNLFEQERAESLLQARPLDFSAGTSSIDGGPAVILDYSAYGEAVAWGMRDEIRKLNDGLFLCMGYMTIGGGSINPAPFVLIAPGPVKPRGAVEPVSGDVSQ